MEEEGFGVIAGVLVGFGIIVYVLVRMGRLIVELFSEYRKFSREYREKPGNLDNPGNSGFPYRQEHHPPVTSILEKFPYYKLLSAGGKKKFSSRVVVFLADKNFVGMNGLALTDDMRILISAAAIQITFGLENYLLPLFHTIRVYREEFFSKLADAELKGGTTPSGVMMFSWKDFLQGYVIPDDKLNLGMHEMAHALILDMLHGSTPNAHLEEEIGHWEDVADHEMQNLRMKRSNFLRAYGGTNEHEFFAVSVEHFFEAPAQFKERLPRVYTRLCHLLNQDPLNAQRDFHFNAV